MADEPQDARWHIKKAQELLADNDDSMNSARGWSSVAVNARSYMADVHLRVAEQIERTLERERKLTAYLDDAAYLDNAEELRFR